MNTQNCFTIPLSIGELPVFIRNNPRAKRLGLRIDTIKDIAYLTVPNGVSEYKAQLFLKNHVGWLEKKLSQRSKQVPFQDNSVVPILGKEYTIAYKYADKPKVSFLEETLHVQGFDPIIITGLVKDWLRNHIYDCLAAHSKQHATSIGKKINSIIVKDTKSRWGSCSSTGNLVYSWRLVFAPSEVVNYVCAHEVAHLAEMNHSKKFWNIVENLCPEYVEHKKWLKMNGQSLFRYG